MDSIVDEAKRLIAKSKLKEEMKKKKERKGSDIYLQTMRTEVEDVSTKRESEERLKT